MNVSFAPHRFAAPVAAHSRNRVLKDMARGGSADQLASALVADVFVVLRPVDGRSLRQEQV